MHPAPPASPRVFTLGDFDFHLPPELIAQQPAPERSASRLLDGTQPLPADRIFRDLPTLLAPGDLLVFNDTRVLKARLFGEKPTGGKVELLVERVLNRLAQLFNAQWNVPAAVQQRVASRAHGHKIARRG